MMNRHSHLAGRVGDADGISNDYQGQDDLDGADVLKSGAGNDWLWGKEGADLMDGGDDVRCISVANDAAWRNLA